MQTDAERHLAIGSFVHRSAPRARTPSTQAGPAHAMGMPWQWPASACAPTPADARWQFSGVRLATDCA